MIKAVIFDCFGVLYRGSLESLYELVPVEKHIELRDLSHASDYGYVSAQEYMARLTDLTGYPTERLTEIINHDHVRNDSLIQTIKELRGRYKTALLSNIGQSVMSKLFSESEFRELFDEVVLSSDIGIAKPSLEIFTLTADRLGLKPSECVMVDDMPRNIEAAKLAGMEGIIFYSNQQFQSDLISLENRSA